MCFSTAGSFTASALLAITGVVAIKKSKSKSYYMHAAIPLLFAMQQFAEGIVWYTLGDSNYPFYHLLAAYIFLSFAFIVWPIWIPASLLRIETDLQRRKILCFLMGLGVLTTCAAGFVMLTHPLSIDVINGKLSYYFVLANKTLPHIHLFLYACATIIGFFVVRLKWLKLVGMCLLLALLGSYFLMYDMFISVWCFVAAVLSAMVLLVVI